MCAPWLVIKAYCKPEPDYRISHDRTAGDVLSLTGTKKEDDHFYDHPLFYFNRLLTD